MSKPTNPTPTVPVGIAVPEVELRLERTGNRIQGAPQVTSTEQAAGILGPALTWRDRENLAVLYLDHKMRPTGYEIAARGTVDQVGTTMKELLRGVILGRAYAVIIAHNHPSGDPRPSDADLQFHAAAEAACKAVGIILIDSLVVAHGQQFTSIGKAAQGQAPVAPQPSFGPGAHPEPQQGPAPDSSPQPDGPAPDSVTIPEGASPDELAKIFRSIL